MVSSTDPMALIFQVILGFISIYPLELLMCPRNSNMLAVPHTSLMEGRGVNGVGVEMMEKFQTMWL